MLLDGLRSSFSALMLRIDRRLTLSSVRRAVTRALTTSATNSGAFRAAFLAFADGVITEFEHHVLWRVADLLAVSPNDRIALRQRVAKKRAGKEKA